MKIAFRLMAVAAGLLVAQVAAAQTPPAGSTGVCKDGTYTSAASKSGACRGHQGVKQWLAADTAAPSTATGKRAAASTSSSPKAMPPASAMAPAAAAPAPAKAPKTSTASTASMPQAAGGGPGMVWVNSATNVYHCPGTKYYGKTKAGSYMSEADAKAKGAHADHGTACSK